MLTSLQNSDFQGRREGRMESCSMEIVIVVQNEQNLEICSITQGLSQCEPQNVSGGSVLSCPDSYGRNKGAQRTCRLSLLP